MLRDASSPKPEGADASADRRAATESRSVTASGDDYSWLFSRLSQSSYLPRIKELLQKALSESRATAGGRPSEGVCDRHCGAKQRRPEWSDFGESLRLQPAVPNLEPGQGYWWWLPIVRGRGFIRVVQAAVSAAKSGNVVELDFDGRREERPLVLTNIDLTFRAAEGRRPILLFRPTEADAVGYPRSMVVVAGGSLSIYQS